MAAVIICGFCLAGIGKTRLNEQWVGDNSGKLSRESAAAFLSVGERTEPRMNMNGHQYFPRVPLWFSLAAVQGCVEEGYDPGKARNTRKGFKGSIYL